MREIPYRAEARDQPENREAAPGALAHALTPAEAHFVRCHFAAPRATAGAIAIGGAVARPASVRLPALRAMEQRTRVVTLECAGNGRVGMMPLPPGEPWGRGAISTAAWTGVPLAALLERAGLRDDVAAILVSGADRGVAVEGAGRPGVTSCGDGRGRARRRSTRSNSRSMPVRGGRRTSSERRRRPRGPVFAP